MVDMEIKGIDQYWTTIEVDIEDVYKALKKNGFEHLRGQWFDLAGDKKGACVLGQAAMNLGVYAALEGASYSTQYWYNEAIEIGHYQELRNFAHDHSLAEALNEFQLENPATNPWTPICDWGMDEYRIGSVIIYWNDLVERDPDGNFVGYELKTYAEVAEMAYDVLKPFFGQKITVATFDYN